MESSDSVFTCPSVIVSSPWGDSFSGVVSLDEGECDAGGLEGMGIRVNAWSSSLSSDSGFPS